MSWYNTNGKIETKIDDLLSKVIETINLFLADFFKSAVKTQTSPPSGLHWITSESKILSHFFQNYNYIIDFYINLRK